MLTAVFCKVGIDQYLKGRYHKLLYAKKTKYYSLTARRIPIF